MCDFVLKKSQLESVIDWLSEYIGDQTPHTVSEQWYSNDIAGFSSGDGWQINYVKLNTSWPNSDKVNVYIDGRKLRGEKKTLFLLKFVQ